MAKIVQFIFMPKRLKNMDKIIEEIIDNIIIDLYNKGNFDFCTDIEAAKAEEECRKSWRPILKKLLDRDPY